MNRGNLQLSTKQFRRRLRRDYPVISASSHSDDKCSVTCLVWTFLA